ncbi:hypothetical protein AX16_007768 [Volvariella volvacea WC 439]|nr:hypothetical protein AX16_007768 [Volvariella volvacea WC 439]
MSPPSDSAVGQECGDSPSILQLTEASFHPVLGALQTPSTPLSAEYNFWLHIIIQPGPRWSLFAQEEYPVGHSVFYGFDDGNQCWVQGAAVRGDHFASTRSIKLAVPVAKLDDTDVRVLVHQHREQSLLVTFLDTIERVRLNNEQDTQQEDMDAPDLLHKALLELAREDIITTGGGTIEERIQDLMDLVYEVIDEMQEWPAHKSFEWVQESQVKERLGII